MPAATHIHCPQCGFDLHGLPDDHRCPECGFGYQKQAIEQLAREFVRTREWLGKEQVVASIACCAMPVLMWLIQLTMYTSLSGRRRSWLGALGIVVIIATHLARQWQSRRLDDDGEWRLRAAVSGWLVIFAIGGTFPQFLSGLMMLAVAATGVTRCLHRTPFPYIELSAPVEVRNAAARWDAIAIAALPCAVLATLVVYAWR